MLLTLACTFLACTQPLPTTPDDGPLLAQGSGDLAVAYFCGNTFQFRNGSLDTVTVQWRVHGVQESGDLFLPGRDGAAYSETYLTTQERGPLQVSLGGQVVITVPNKHTAQCEIPVTDTTMPIPPATAAIPVDTVLLVRDPSDTLTWWYRSHFAVRFKPAVSGAQVRRWLVQRGGTIVGAYPTDDPTSPVKYIIRFPDPRTGMPGVQALEASLLADSLLDWVLREGLSGRIRQNGVFPNDGMDAKRANYSAGRLTSVTRPLDAINAPLAWGCFDPTATTIPTIGVIDLDFDEGHPDLAGDRISRVEPPAALTFEMTPAGEGVNLPYLDDPYRKTHGTSVLGVLGAVGNNGTGTAGMVWGAKMRIYSFTRGERGISLRIPGMIDAVVRDALRNNIRILVYSGDAGTPSPTWVHSIEETFRTYLDEPGRRNMIIVGAGNDGARGTRDYLISHAGFNATTQALLFLSEEFPGQIAFVAGDDGAGNLWAEHGLSSNLVTDIPSVTAPAQTFTTLVDRANGGSEGTGPFNATSAATPFVGGLAAMILGQAPSLTAPEVMDLLYHGAQAPRYSRDSGFMVVPSPINGAGGQVYSQAYAIDAYSSLKLAAQRANTPLCGNRLWGVGNGVYAQRSSGPELVGKVSDDAGQILPYHGGRKVLIQKGESARFAVYELGTGGVWDSTGLWDRRDSTGLAGSGLSALGFVHDRDSVAFLGTGGVKMGRSFFGTARSVGSVLTGTSSASGETCVVEKKDIGTWKCDVTVYLTATETSLPSAVVTPIGDTRLLWAQESVKWETTVQAPWLDCWSLQPANDNSTCRFHERSTTVTPLGTSIWEMDRAATGNGTPRRVFDIPDNRLVASITASEDGESVAIATGASLLPNSRMSECQTQYYIYAPGQMSPSGPPVGYGTSCTNYNWQGGFGAAQQQLTAAPTPSTGGFALQARARRAVPQ